MFYYRLKQVCAEAGTSPSAVLQSLGMSKANVTNWKRGISPNMATVIKIAAKLDVSVSRLISDQASA